MAKRCGLLLLMSAFTLCATVSFSQPRKKPPKPKTPAVVRTPTPPKETAAASVSVVRTAIETPLSNDEKEILDAINAARANPSSALAVLAEYRKYYQGKAIYLPKATGVITEEGPAAVDEAQHFVSQLKPLPAYQVSTAVSQAARDHLQDLIANNRQGHHGSDNSWPPDRVKKRGVLTDVVGENISYFSANARSVLFWMMIDDGNSKRGHRNNIFSSLFSYIGIACGQSKANGLICVMTFSEIGAR